MNKTGISTEGSRGPMVSKEGSRGPVVSKEGQGRQRACGSHDPSREKVFLSIVSLSALLSVTQTWCLFIQDYFSNHLEAEAMG